MQTRSSARRAAQALQGQTTAPPSSPSPTQPSLPHDTTKSLEIHISRNSKASKRFLRASGPNNAIVSSEPMVEAPTGQVLGQTPALSLKRGTEPSDSVSGEKPAKRSRRQRLTVTKLTLPADVLPHGLGRVHSINAEDSKGNAVGPISASTLTTSGDNSDPISKEELVPIINCFVQNIIEEAVHGAVEHIHKTPKTAPEAPPVTRQLRPRKTQRPQQPTPFAKTVVGNADDADAFNQEEETEKTFNKTKQKRVPRKTKENPYGLMPGRTPFPDWAGPTPEECREVHQVLTELHGEFKMPDKIPAPSTSVAGCGEVPDLVDAMIRTLISGHTAMANANLAIQDVTAKYGQWPEESIGARSIDWNKVRISEESEVVQAVKRAGLGPTKGKDIKLILEQVFLENQQRQREYLREKATGEPCDMSGSRQLTQGQKEHQVLKIQRGVLTLDHIRGMTPDEAMLELTKYPGIGVKTASCLILFCLQQPSFAVDTHVWRFCKWLKWVPPKASRDDTYMHGEVRIPDDLKYGLHQLFIRHGKECGRCRSGTVEGTSEWDGVVCPLEHLLDRFDKRKTKLQPRAKKSAKRNKVTEEDAGSDDEYED